MLPKPTDREKTRVFHSERSTEASITLASTQQLSQDVRLSARTLARAQDNRM